MKNLVCNEKFGINCASAEAQFGTGRGIMLEKFGKILDIRKITFRTERELAYSGSSVVEGQKKTDSHEARVNIAKH